ncbi:adenosylcobinamide-GDP ribazoletransferase [Bacillota bacterium LX-D]|nr:adenosylcobinamide-GDP ribazoletransferase [Bacillota bacterium LX-D]
MEFLIAVQFLTKFPITITRPIDEKNIAKAMSYFSLVGLLLGGCSAALRYGLSYLLPIPVCNLLALAFLIFSTGNLHYDGLMDTADGLFSGRPKERILEIMKDSRVGSNGVTAGALALLLKYVLLSQIPLAGQGIALVLASALGRWSQVYGAAFYKYARSTGTGSFTQYVGYWQLFFNSFTVLFAAFFLLHYLSILFLLSILAGTAFLQWYVWKKIGGITGDTLGAVHECIEVLSLMVLLIIFTKF